MEHKLNALHFSRNILDCLTINVNSNLSALYRETNFLHFLVFEFFQKPLKIEFA